MSVFELNDWESRDKSESLWEWIIIWNKVYTERQSDIRGNIPPKEIKLKKNWKTFPV